MPWQPAESELQLQKRYGKPEFTNNNFESKLRSINKE